MLNRDRNVRAHVCCIQSIPRTRTTIIGLYQSQGIGRIQLRGCVRPQPVVIKDGTVRHVVVRETVQSHISSRKWVKIQSGDNEITRCPKRTVSVAIQDATQFQSTTCFLGIVGTIRFHQSFCELHAHPTTVLVVHGSFRIGRPAVGKPTVEGRLAVCLRDDGQVGHVNSFYAEQRTFGRVGGGGITVTIVHFVVGGYTKVVL